MEKNPNFLKSFTAGQQNGFSGQFYQQRSLSTSSASSISSSSSSQDNSPLSDQLPSSPMFSETMECTKCSRQGAPLFCFSCGFWMANGRVSQPCSRHPKVIFYTDFKSCPKCKSGQLRELD